jgi:hypothetical protein
MKLYSFTCCVLAAYAAMPGSASASSAIVEPPTDDNVRICSAYGVGYFYIPGTETCLRIAGFDRLDVSVGPGGRVLDGNATTDSSGKTHQSLGTMNRFAPRISTAQDTDYGTLKTYTELWFDVTNEGSTKTTIGYSWIQLGGLRVGKDVTPYDKFIGYAGNIIQDQIIPYGVKNTDVLSYYFNLSRDVSGYVSAEDGYTTDAITGYIPHIDVGLKLKQDWGTLTAVGAYNSKWDEYAGKVRLDVNLNKDLSLFFMAGYGTSNNVATNDYKPWYGNAAFWSGGSYQLSKSTQFNTQVVYTNYGDFVTSANVAWQIVRNYTITPELDYYHNFDGRYKSGLGGIVRFEVDF